MAAAFRMTVRYVSFAPPESLKGVDDALFTREANKVSRLWSQAAEEVVLALRQATLDVFGSVVEKMTPLPTGDRRALKDKPMAKIFEFLEAFRSRNVANDLELDALVRRARDVLQGVDMNALRKQDDLRTQVRAQFEELKARAEALAKEPPGRLISFSDEEE
jgi:hypothetical protein